jgi:dihydrofolate reductase
MVSLIVAVSENKVIGKDNDLAWVLPLDLKYFKDTTKDHFVIMGRKNFESIPEKYRPLPNRTNVIVTRNKDYKSNNCIVVNSIEKALELAKESNDQEPFVIGGGQIYKYAIENNLVDKIYLTRVHAKIEGDTFFEDLNDDWELLSSTPHKADHRHAFDFTFLVYKKIKKN